MKRWWGIRHLRYFWHEEMLDWAKIYMSVAQKEKAKAWLKAIWRGEA